MAMSSQVALASPCRVPTSTRLPSKTFQYHPERLFSKRLQVPQFSGLRASSCVTFARDATEASFLEVVASQLTPKAAVPAYVRGETVAKLRVAINGFGRVGRMFFRSWYVRQDSPIEVVAVNHSGDVNNARYLLQYDSTFGKIMKYDPTYGLMPETVTVLNDHTMLVGEKPITVVSNRDPLQLPWAELDIDLVIEATGVFVDGPGAGKHIQAGAKKVIIADPAKGAEIPTYIVGVNEGDYTHEVSNIISGGSGITTSVAPLAKFMDEEFGIVKGTVTTTHAYTGDQRLLDAPHLDLRRARAAVLNIVPLKTDAVEAVALVAPKLMGKLDGIMLRVPTADISSIDIVVNVEKKGMTAEDVNAAFKKAAEGPFKGILAVNDIPLVSVDFLKATESATVDSSFTMVRGDDMVKVLAWFDNEWVYCERVVDLADVVAKKWPGVDAAGSGDPLENYCKTSPSAEECKVF